MTDTHFETAESTRRRGDESDIAWADRTYRPSFPGVHVCGGDHDENRFFTVLDVPAMTNAEADAWFAAAKAAAEVAKDEGELVVDRCRTDGHDEDFWTNRQMLPRLVEALRAAGATL